MKDRFIIILCFMLFIFDFWYLANVVLIAFLIDKIIDYLKGED